MLRFVFSKGAMDHVGFQELKQLSWLSIPDRVNFFKLVHVFKIRCGTSPVYLSANFKPVQLAHSYGTRGSSYNYFISKDIARSSKSFVFTAVKLWNGLPVYLKQIESVSVFKVKLKEYLLAQY